MSHLNYYEVLGLEPTCTPHEIKKSYRQLALIWHPDKHNNKREAEIQFTSINEAYTILSDAGKRQIYDTYGHERLNSSQDGFSKPNNKKNFCQKGFYGTDKSAFDVLKDIFMDKDDDNFFESCNISSTYSKMKSNIESMVFEQLFSSEGEGNNFYTDYIPTFMNTTFTSPFSSLNDILVDEKSSASFFSSVFVGAFESESSSKDKKRSKNTQRKKKNCDVVFTEEKDSQSKESAKFSSSLNKQKTKLSKPQMNRKGSFLSSNGNEIIEEEFYVEIKIIDHKKNQSYFDDILDDNTYDIRPRKKCSEGFSGKSYSREEMLQEGRKRVKK